MQQAQPALLAQALHALGECGGNGQREKSLIRNSQGGAKSAPWAGESNKYLGCKAKILAYFRMMGGDKVDERNKW